jgi:hypothetical protein
MKEKSTFETQENQVLLRDGDSRTQRFTYQGACPKIQNSVPILLLFLETASV